MSGANAIGGRIICLLITSILKGQEMNVDSRQEEETRKGDL